MALRFLGQAFAGLMDDTSGERIKWLSKGESNLRDALFHSADLYHIHYIFTLPKAQSQRQGIPPFRIEKIRKNYYPSPTFSIPWRSELIFTTHPVTNTLEIHVDTTGEHWLHPIWSEMRNFFEYNSDKNDEEESARYHFSQRQFASTEEIYQHGLFVKMHYSTIQYLEFFEGFKPFPFIDPYKTEYKNYIKTSKLPARHTLNN